MKKTILSFLTLLAISTGVNAQNVNIPDANFKAYLVGNAAINTNGDTEIQVTEASAFNGTIICSSLSISDLTGIEAFVNLSSLRCDNNNLTSLDVSSNTSLTTLECYINNITSLDLSQHPVITTVYAYNNDLTSLNVANGNNVSNNDMSLVNNPNLTCIQVDAGFTPPPNGAGGWYKDATASYSDNCAPCTVTIPDANFKSYLVGNAAINTNGDTEIQCSEASAFTGTINCPASAIADLTGIEAFTSLTELSCSVNSLTSLDVSSNISLISLYCYSNSLTSLDVSNVTSLQTLQCNDNFLTSISVSQNTQLTTLWCQENSIASIDVTQNIALTNFACGNNLLSSLDVTLNTALTKLYCDNNTLTALNVANGNNSNFSNFIANNNPNLTCITVDDVAYSTTNWTNIDAIASFSMDCNGGVGVNEVADIQFNIYPNPVQNELFIETSELNVIEMTILDLSGKVIKTITNNNAQSIDVSNLNQGVYILKIHTENGVSTNRFIKQ